MAPDPGRHANAGKDRPSPTDGAGPTKRRLQAFQLFFMGAAVFAGVAVPIWVLEYLGRIAGWQDDPARWHGHEMVFGYALAVVAGYLIAKASRAAIVAAFCLWMAGRVASSDR